LRCVRRTTFWTLLCALVLSVLAIDIYVGEGIDAYYRSRLPDMVHGTAYRPYVYRTLVPTTARLGVALLPQPARDALVRVFAGWTWRPETWRPEAAADYVFVVALMAVSLAGFAVALRRLCEATLPTARRASVVAPLVALASVPLFFGPFGREIYDFSTLWLMTLGLLWIAEAKLIAYAMLFPFACLNKETAILLPLVFAWHYRRRDATTAYVTLLVYQLVVFAAVRIAVTYVFRHNPGGAVEWHLFDHNLLVIQHPTLMSKRLFVFLGAIAVGMLSWERMPRFLRSAFVVMAPVMAVMGITVGQVDEIRAYFEIYPVIVLMIASNFA
jgi:hypothetical protein